MCKKAELENSPHKHMNWNFIYYICALIAAIGTGYSDISWLHNVAEVISKIFVNSFKCLSLPIIALSIIVTFCQSGEKSIMNRIWKRSILYTFSTTIIAASVACLLYIIVRPVPINAILDKNESLTNMEQSSYFSFIIDLFPENILQPFIEQKVLTVVLLAVLIGFALRNIKNSDARNTMFNITKGLHEIFLTITNLLIKLMPLGLYGFVALMLIQLKQGVIISGLWSYFIIIIGANVLQGFIILPLFLLFNKQQPYKLMRKAIPALSVAFFSKSSTGTLPVTIEVVEKNMQVSNKISRFVLPLCTTLNMNGCAAFIFVTVIYLMQCNGIIISIPMLMLWVVIATIAAIGNAGVPMGCFFLSASLLVNMNIPINILGLILPIYGLIDMIETALNVWSDICITKVVDHKEKTYEFEETLTDMSNITNLQ